MGFKYTAFAYLILILYVAFGALLFWLIEHQNEKEDQKKYFDTYWNISQQNCISLSDMNHLINISIKSPQFFNQLNKTNVHLWDFYGSLFFGIVIVSTVGFGNQVPSTMLGQVTVVFYAIVGIPIFMNAMTQASALMTFVMEKMDNHLHPKFRKRHSVFAALIIFALFIVIFIMPALFIKSEEGWTLHETMYFSFIALSTIGFGDYVPGNLSQTPRYYKVFLLIWMLVGLTYIAILVGYFQILLNKGFTYLGTKHETTVKKIKSKLNNRKKSKDKLKKVVKF